jgi:hypothetical protein
MPDRFTKYTDHSGSPAGSPNGDLLVFDEHGLPYHIRGVVLEVPGMYFLGLLFPTALNTYLIGGMGADTAYIVGQIIRQVNRREMHVPVNNFTDA